MKELKDEIKRKVLINNREIGRLLQENECLLKGEGLNPPIDNWTPEESKKINFPRFYIRTKKAFEEKYCGLSKITTNKKNRDNIIYHLMYTDYLNYQINRFHIWGVLRNIQYQQAITVIVSIIEAMIFETLTKKYRKCEVCKKHNCASREKNPKKIAFKTCVQYFQDENIICLKEDELHLLLRLVDIRNNVHIRLQETRTYFEDNYSMENYNKAIELLQKIYKQLITFAPSTYSRRC